jgi:hypothetical protein
MVDSWSRGVVDSVNRGMVHRWSRGIVHRSWRWTMVDSGRRGIVHSSGRMVHSWRRSSSLLGSRRCKLATGTTATIRKLVHPGTLGTQPQIIGYLLFLLLLLWWWNVADWTIGTGI